MSVTRVPLQPIAKGSLTKLWLGVALCVVIAVALALFATSAFQFGRVVTDTGVVVTTIEEGEGELVSDGDVALVSYTGTLDDGTVFDQSEQAPLAVSGVVPGMASALKEMKKGGKYRVRIPADQAYGDQARGEIPANSALNFEMTLIDFRSEAELRQQFEAMQQQQQLQGQQLPPDLIPQN